MIAGIARNLTCTTTLTNADDILVMVNFTWSIDGMSLPTLPRITTSGTFQSGDQSSFTSTLIFNPLDNNMDSGEYLCVVMMESVPPDTYITPTITNNTLFITVECESTCMYIIIPLCDMTALVPTPALSAPTVMITTTGTMSPGSSLTLTCEVGVVEGLVVEPVIVWSKSAVSGSTPELTSFNIISVEPMQTDNTLTLQFNPINTSDAGVYTCTATVAVEAINITVSNFSKVNVRIQCE